MTLPVAWLDSPIHQVDVYTDHLGAPIAVGRLNYERATGAAYFEWSADAQRMALDLSPLRLPLGTEIWSSRQDSDLPVEYRGLPGLLNDALPDGWGLYLMDRALARAGIPPDQITPAARLAFLGDRAWGALSFQPVIQEDLGGVMTLDALGRDMEATIEGHLDTVSAEFLQAGSSPQGARPKVMVDCDADFHHAQVTAGASREGFRSWLIKFAARDEPVDAPLVEQAYMDCARQAGLSVMDSRILDIQGKPAFATERFDRPPSGRVFTQTLGGLMHFSHRAVGLDYANVAEVMDALRVPEPAFRQAYMRAAFNAALSVRDDHAKNFAFVKGRDNRWDIAHAYDLTYTQGPGGYHTMTFADGDTMDPTYADLLKLAPYYRLDEVDARSIVQAMIDVATEVGPRARDLGVSRDTIAPIEERLNAVAKSLAPARGRARIR